jgi:hypothetical protein
MANHANQPIAQVANNQGRRGTGRSGRLIADGRTERE